MKKPSMEKIIFFFSDGRKNMQNYETIISTIYMKPDFATIKKILRKL